MNWTGSAELRAVAPDGSEVEKRKHARHRNALPHLGVIDSRHIEPTRSEKRNPCEARQRGHFMSDKPESHDQPLKVTKNRIRGTVHKHLLCRRIYMGSNKRPNGQPDPLIGNADSNYQEIEIQSSSSARGRQSTTAKDLKALALLVNKRRRFNRMPDEELLEVHRLAKRYARVLANWCGWIERHRGDLL